MKLKDRLYKILDSWVGAIIFLVVGFLLIYFILGTSNITLYILVLIGVPALYLIKKQDILPYIYGGIILAFVAHLVLGLIFATNLPVVAVVSGSMYHGVESEPSCQYCVCGKNLPNYQNNFDNWWDTCKDPYLSVGITKEQFESFPIKDGFNVGDMPIIQGSANYKVGDVVVYNAGQSAPIIHRIIKINSDGTYQTRGDHNSGQLPYETSVKKEQIEGRVIFVVPYLGWFKVIFSKAVGG